MRKTAIIGAAVTTFLCGSPAMAQYYGGIPTGRIILDACYDPEFRVSDRQVQLIVPYVNEVMEKYASTVRSGGNLDDLFYGKREQRHWVFDGAEVDPRSAKDPWIGTSSRLQPVQYVRSNAGAGGAIISRWNVIGDDGRVLGTYDAVMVARARHFAFKKLNLHSPAGAAALQPLKTFCLDPGDIEKWQAAKAKRGAEKAAREAREH